jgi:hypothetical protein
MQKKRTVASLANVVGLDAEGCAALCNAYGERCATFVHRGDTSKCKLYGTEGSLYGARFFTNDRTVLMLEDAVGSHACCQFEASVRVSY